MDCGVALSGQDGRGEKAPVRCQRCAAVASGKARKVWTREALILAIKAWAREHGGAGPTSGDWNGPRAALPDRWPLRATVHREFGSWAAALSAASVPHVARRRRTPDQRPPPTGGRAQRVAPAPAARESSRQRRGARESDEVAALREAQRTLKAQAMARWAAKPNVSGANGRNRYEVRV
ncbi:MAG TPA: hypothetical protein VMY78_16535 [Solirubrobacteraceae bacterium]|nr:hypothetical protein [Solirubrobacteraceae bacterium]